MQYLKRNIKYGIFTFFIIILSINISISTLAKTEIYFSLYDNPQILLITSLNPEVQNINKNNVFHDEFLKVLKISEPLAQKITILRNKLNGFKNPKDLLRIPELTNIDLHEWKEEGIKISVN
jgi:DNA uptake protein ComE-like DNA-binding protein